MLAELKRLKLNRELFNVCIENIDKFNCTFDLIEYAERIIELENMECPF